MNTAQKRLLDKTISAVGWLCVISGGGLALLILSIGVVTENSGLLNELFGFRDMGRFVWSVLPVGIVLLWVRAFMRAGNTDEQSRQVR